MHPPCLAPCRTEDERTPRWAHGTRRPWSQRFRSQSRPSLLNLGCGVDPAESHDPWLSYVTDSPNHPSTFPRHRWAIKMPISSCRRMPPAVQLSALPPSDHCPLTTASCPLTANLPPTSTVACKVGNDGCLASCPACRPPALPNPSPDRRPPLTAYHVDVGDNGGLLPPCSVACHRPPPLIHPLPPAQ